MNKRRKISTLFSLFITVLLIFSFAGQALAAQHNNGHGNNGKGNNKDRNQFTLGFDDIFDTDWAIEHIAKMKSKNVFNGYEDGTFRPNQPVNRVEAIVTAVRLMGLDEAAKKKSLDTTLHFKDADQIDKHYKWAKGYIIVALEKGLFDIAEDKLDPGTPASRVWAASLLVRALGLQTEALSKMTIIPDFKDAKAIPAGALGYVNVAVERGIVSGYPDRTFQPNKKVTRAEMAAFLDRTNDGMQDELGAITVTGKITSINFKTLKDNDNTHLNGAVVIESFNGNSLGYAISSKLWVLYHNRFITAEQLLAGDMVALIVKDGAVLEAYLLSEDDYLDNIKGINELKIKVATGDKDGYQLKYKNNKGKVDAEVEKKVNNKTETVKGKEAVAAVETFVTKLALSPSMSNTDIINKVLGVLQISNKQFSKLEIEIKFSNGKKVDIDEENKDFGKDTSGYLGIRTFELEIELLQGEEIKLKYEHKNGKAIAEVERKTKSGKEKYSDSRAVIELEKLLGQLLLSSNMTKEKVLETLLNKLNLKQENVKEIELKVNFTDGKKLDINEEYRLGYLGIRTFELELELLQGEEIKLKYDYKNGNAEAEVERKTKSGKEKYSDSRAVIDLEKLLGQLLLSSNMTKEKVLETLLNKLNLKQENVKHIELKVNFADGKKLDIDEQYKLEYLGIRTFELEMELSQGEEIKLKYENKDGKTEAEVERKTKSGKEKYSDSRAVVYLEKLLTELALTSDMTNEKVLTTVLTKLNVNKENIKELELEVSFIDGKKVDVEIEQEKKKNQNNKKKNRK